VIIDATFLDPVHRDMFRALALQQRCRFLIVSCVSDAATLNTRLETRIRNGLDPSEATHAVLDEQLRSLQPLTAEEMLHAVNVDTSRPGSADAGFVEIRTRLAKAP
jgi:predicted kinase